MKRVRNKQKNVLVILKGYSLGFDTGDKIRAINMANSLYDMGYNVFFLAFFTKKIHLITKERKSLPGKYKTILLFTLPNRWRLQKVAELLRAIITYLICKLYSIDFIQAETTSSATAARFVPKIPLVTDFHADLVPELEMVNSSAKAIQYGIYENIFALQRSKAIITVSENLYHNLSAYTKHSAQNYILPCNFKPEPFLHLPENTRHNLRSQYNLNDRIVLCYSGGLYTWQCVKETIEIVIRLHRLNQQYFFCLFTNDDISPYKKLLDKLGKNYFKIGLKGNEVATYLSMIDAGFVLRTDNPVNTNSSPTKTSEYLASGAMIITTPYAGDAPQLVKESDCGAIINDLSLITEEQLVKLNDEIIKYTDNYKSNSKKAKEYVFKKRVWAFNEKQLNLLYQDIMDS